MPAPLPPGGGIKSLGMTMTESPLGDLIMFLTPVEQRLLKVHSWDRGTRMELPQTLTPGSESFQA